MNETTPVVPAPEPQPELFMSGLNGIANRLISLHVDKLLFMLIAFVFVCLSIMYGWLYFHPSW